MRASVEEYLPMPACMVCAEFDQLRRLPCGHHYCDGCLRNFLENRITGSPFHPVGCCGDKNNITAYYNNLRETASILQELAKPDDFSVYLKKLDECLTVDKLYCWVKTCNTFIPTSCRLLAVGTCPECYSGTCTKCKSKSHVGWCATHLDADARADARADAKVKRVARKKGWRPCPLCHQLVEKRGGCDMIV